MKENPLLLFDGVCNLCNRSVQFVIQHDRKKIFRFGTLQSQCIDGESVVVRYQGRDYTRSAAVLKVAQLLGWPWKAFSIFRFLPRGWRDAMYDWIARNRYRWFGRRQECMIPTPELKSRFI